MAVINRSFSGATRYIKSDTTDGSTVFTDSSGNSFPITVTGDIYHSTDQHKFGASSIEINNSSGSLVSGCPGYPVAIDFWIFLTEYPSSTQRIINSADPDVSVCHLDLSSSGTLSLVWLRSDADPLIRTLPLGEWVHVLMSADCAVVATYHEPVYNNYLGTWSNAYYSYECTYNLELAVGGALVKKTFTQSALPIATESISFSNFNGYLDDIFISNSPALGSSFTPPVSSASETNFFITGTVMKGTSYVARTVCAYDSVTKELLGCAISSAETGIYTISNIPTSVTQVFCVALRESNDLHSLILDPVAPIGD